MKARVLVTGSQGTLGRPLVQELRARGHVVTGADLMHAFGDLRTDIRDASQVNRTFERVKPEVVMHLAGEFGRANGQDYPSSLWSTNCLGTRNIIDACLRHAAHLVFASSSEAYGDIADMSVLKEDVLSTSVPVFHNEYALTKWTNEKQIEIATRNQGLRATILRFFNVYGPGEHYSSYRSVVCLFIYRMLHNMPIVGYAGSTRSFLYISDWTNCVTNVLHSLPCDTFNIASTEQVGMRELVSVVKAAIPETVSPIQFKELEPMNVQHKQADVQKAMAQLGLKQTVGLREGVRHTVKWMREQHDGR